MKNKIFISYHHSDDEFYKELFIKNFSFQYDILLNRTELNKMDNKMSTEFIQKKIRNECLIDSIVTIVLIGAQTWQSKNIDWEIASSLSSDESNARSGLIGILLPTYPLYLQNKFDPFTIPPRFYDNLKIGYAKIYKWTTSVDEIDLWIQEAIQRKEQIPPDQTRPWFSNNRVGANWS